MLAVPADSPVDGVSVAVYSLEFDGETSNPASVPPVVVMSEAVKPSGASLNKKLMIAFCTVDTVATLLVMASVGASASMVMSGVTVKVLLADARFNAASVNFPLATVTLALVSALRVRLAVRVRPVPLMLPKVPPTSVTSVLSKPTGGSLNQKVMVAVV